MSLITSVQNDVSKINWVRGLVDPGEMIGCGMYQQLRRQNGESDSIYQRRIERELLLLPVDHASQIKDAMVLAATRRASLSSKRDEVQFVANELVDVWHELGKTTNRDLSFAEFRKAVLIDDSYVAKIPCQYTLPSGLVVVDDSHVALVDECERLLGYTTSAYEVVQFRDFFSDDFGEVLQRAELDVTCGGVIDDGRRAFICCDVGGYDLFGDEHRRHIHFSTGHACDTIEIFAATLRAVCKNTLRAAKNGSKNLFRAKHTKNVHSKLDAIKASIEKARVAMDEQREKLTLLAAYSIPDSADYFHFVLDSLLDHEVIGQRLTRENIRSGKIMSDILALTDAGLRDKAERQFGNCVTRRENLFSDICERWESERCDTGRGTLYSAFQAVTEAADHGSLTRYNGEDTRVARFDSILTGRADEIKQTALDLALTIAS